MAKVPGVEMFHGSAGLTPFSAAPRSWSACCPRRPRPRASCGSTAAQAQARRRGKWCLPDQCRRGAQMPISGCARGGSLAAATLDVFPTEPPLAASPAVGPSPGNHYAALCRSLRPHALAANIPPDRAPRAGCRSSMWSMRDRVLITSSWQCPAIPRNSGCPRPWISRSGATGRSHPGRAHPARARRPRLREDNAGRSLRSPGARRRCRRRILVDLHPQGCGRHEGAHRAGVELEAGPT